MVQGSVEGIINIDFLMTKDKKASIVIKLDWTWAYGLKWVKLLRNVVIILAKALNMYIHFDPRISTSKELTEVQV